MVEPRIDYDGEIEVYCLSCSWKQTLGLDARHNLVLESFKQRAKFIAG